MQAHHFSSTKRVRRRIGRGGKRGSFSGRGIKGQKARAGRHIRPQVRDIIKKMHKMRGHGKNRAKSAGPSVLPVRAISLGAINNYFKDGDHVTETTLIKAKLARARQSIKILGGGKLIKKITFDKTIPMSHVVRKTLKLDDK